MDFSIVIPTRERPAALRDTLSSLLTNTLEKDLLEVLLVLDKDDPLLTEYFKLCDEFALRISCYVRPRTDGHFCRDYYNWGAEKTTGANIMMFNDDACIETKDWDFLAMEAIGHRKVYMLNFRDSTYDTGDFSFPKFPMISRKAYEALGWFFYPQVRMWGADNLCYQMFERSGTIIECHGVRIRHDHIPSTKFNEWYELDKKEGVFPVAMDREVYALLEARGKYDRTRT